MEISCDSARDEDKEIMCRSIVSKTTFNLLVSKSIHACFLGDNLKSTLNPLPATSTEASLRAGDWIGGRLQTAGE